MCFALDIACAGLSWNISVMQIFPLQIVNKNLDFIDVLTGFYEVFFRIFV